MLRQRLSTLIGCLLLSAQAQASSVLCDASTNAVSMSPDGAVQVTLGFNSSGATFTRQYYICNTHTRI
jgi:hypothetical protein